MSDSESDKSLDGLNNLKDIDRIIDQLPKELLDAMKKQNIVLIGVEEVRIPLSKAVFHSKKEELIKQLRTQLNLRMP